MHVGRVVSTAVIGSSLVVTGAGASFAAGDPEPQAHDQSVSEEQNPTIDDAEVYLDSISADPDQELVQVGYDVELDTEIYDSPLGEFYVDEDTASDAVGVLPDEDAVVIPGIGAVEYVLADFEVDDLSREATDEFEEAGLEVKELFERPLAPLDEATVLPDTALVQAAAACEVPLGANAIDSLEECVQMSATSASSDDEGPVTVDP